MAGVAPRMFLEFCLYVIPYVFLNSVYFRIVYGIALNSAKAEFCIMEFVEFWRISRNSVTVGVTKFRVILTSGVKGFKMLLFLNDSAQTTFEGIRNSIYTNLYGIPRHIPFLLYFSLIFLLEFSFEGVRNSAEFHCIVQ